MTSGGMPELGSKISLISKADIRYEGRLYTVDPNECTIALSSVRSFGTEDRETQFQIAPQSQIYDYILFRGSDIKDIRVVNNGMPHPNDPAIMQVQLPNGQHLMPHFPMQTMNPPMANYANPFGAMGGLGGIGSSAATATGLAPGSFMLNKPKQPSELNDAIPQEFSLNAINNSSTAAPPNAPSTSAAEHKDQDLLAGASRSPTPINSLTSRKSPSADMAVQVNQQHNNNAGNRDAGHKRQNHQQRGGNNNSNHIGNAKGNSNGGGGGGGGRGSPRFSYRPRERRDSDEDDDANLLIPVKRDHNNHNNHNNNQRNQNQNQINRGWMHRGNNNNNNMRNRGRGRLQNVAFMYMNGNPSINMNNRRPNTIKFDKDFDFEQANNKFEELRSQLSKLKVGDEPKTEQINGETDKKDDSGNETGAGDHEPEEEQIVVGYDKTKSFFDNISCEAQDRKKNKKIDWRNERKLNSQTFGASSRRGSYRGRGNYYNRNMQVFDGAYTYRPYRVRTNHINGRMGQQNNQNRRQNNQNNQNNQQPQSEVQPQKSQENNSQPQVTAVAAGQ